MKMLWKLTDNIKYEDCEVRGSSLISFISCLLFIMIIIMMIIIF